MKRWQQGAWLAVGLSAALTVGCRLDKQAPQDAPAFFAFSASGFPAWGLADSQGRVLHLDASQLRRLGPERWVAIDFEGRSSVWFDGSGRSLARRGYVEINAEPFQRNPEDPDQSPLWNIWSNDRVGLVDANGRLPLPWQNGHGEWRATVHPERILWRPRGGGEVIFDWHGRERLRLADEGPVRVSGPFPSRALYLICEAEREKPCSLRDEAGVTLFEAHIDELRELDDGRWLARWDGLWRVLDAQGQAVGDSVYSDGLGYYQRLRPLVSATRVPVWPVWMSAYRVADGGKRLLPDSEVKGFLHSDGSFHPVPKATHEYRLCPDTWRVNDAAEEPSYWLVDARGQRLGPMPDDGWQPVEAHPGWFIAHKEGRQEALVDCRGTRLFEDTQVRELKPMGTGFAGTLADESEPRVWIDAQLRKHLLPEGSRIQLADADGDLLLVQTEQGMRLYNLARAGFVGEAFDHADTFPPRA